MQPLRRAGEHEERLGQTLRRQSEPAPCRTNSAITTDESPIASIDSPDGAADPPAEPLSG